VEKLAKVVTGNETGTFKLRDMIEDADAYHFGDKDSQRC
jgi:hypothetical protein